MRRPGRVGTTRMRDTGARQVSADGNAAVTGERSQMESFTQGMRLLHARQFQQAQEFFRAAQGGPDRTVAQRAGIHALTCERLFESAGLKLSTADDHYNYAVTLLNARELAAAQVHLELALEADATADHVLYALAACQSLAGDFQRAYTNLRRAIDLQPRNRRAAREDTDFSVAMELPLFRLLCENKKP
jgi:tetratricopeptide (TPR) repeat protein